ncbi:hypothetical protein KCU85_g2735, partial [Aureobasidium melanogenum]
MPAIDETSAAAGPITREMLFQLMVLARDTSFPDAQIRAICDTITQENANDSIELLRRLHASQDTSLVLASAVGSVKSAAIPRSKPPLRQSSSEPGAVLCADTFYRLCREDRVKLQRLGTFCPFTVNFRKCPHGRACQLKHICWDTQCKRPASCSFSHEVSPTCDTVFDGTRCSRTRRLVNDDKKRACPRNHDYKVRLFMGAMRIPHELGFYGVDNAHTGLSITPPNEIHDAVKASWRAPNTEDKHSQREEPLTIAEVGENDIPEESHEETAVDDSRSGSDLILFT